MRTGTKRLIALLVGVACVGLLGLLVARGFPRPAPVIGPPIPAALAPPREPEPQIPAPAERRETTPATDAAPEEAPAARPGGSISGRVIDARGEPIAGAIVQLGVSADTVDRLDEELARALRSSATTADDGVYRLAVLPPRSDYTLRATHPEFAPTSAEDIVLGTDEVLVGADLTLLRGGAVAGRVVNEAGNGVAGARLWVRLASSPEEGWAAPFEVVSHDPSRTPDVIAAPDGRFRLPHLPAAPHSLRARDPGAKLLPGFAADIEVEEEQTTELADLVLGAGERLAGRVVDTDGKPLPGAKVSASNAAPAISGEDGAFEVTGLPRGKTNVNVLKEGYDLLIDEPEVPAADVVYALLPTGAIIGRVRAAGQDSFPKFRIEVRCRLPDGVEMTNVESLDASGRFEVQGKAGAYVLTARVPGFAPSQSPEIILGPHERKEGIVIDLDRGGTIRGRIVAKGSGQPLAGADISVRRTAETGVDRWAPASGAPGAESGADGSFVLEGVLEGTVDLDVQHPGHTAAELHGVEVQSGRTAEVIVELSEGGRIRGTVRRGDKPVSGATIGAMRWGEHISHEGLADSEGRFEVKGLEDGEYVVRSYVRSPSGGRVSRAAVLVVVKDGETTEVDLVEPGVVTLSGRISVGGSPFGAGRIEVEDVERGESDEGTVDAAGTYSLSVESGRTYIATVQRAGDGMRSFRARVSVPTGASEARRDLDLPGGELAGVVVEKDAGKAIPGAQVWAFPAGSPASGSVSLHRAVRSLAVTDDDGRFVLPGLAPGDYSARAFAAGHVDGQASGIRVEADAVAAEVRIELEAGIRCSAKVVDAGGQPIEGASLSLRAAAGELVRLEAETTGEDGTATLLTPREGDHRLLVLHAEYAPRCVPVAIAADMAPLVVPLQKGGKLRVRARTPSGKPLEGVAVRLSCDEGELPGGDLVPCLEDLGLPAVTQIDGYLVVQDAPPGVYRVSAATEAGASEPVSVAVHAGKTAEVELIVGR